MYVCVSVFVCLGACVCVLCICEYARVCIGVGIFERVYKVLCVYV